MATTLGSQVRHNVNAAQAILNGNPDSSTEWRAIVRQLRAAADKARIILKLAERMEDSESASVGETDTETAIHAFDMDI